MLQQRIYPYPWQTVKRVNTPLIQIDIMPHSLETRSIPTFVGIDSVFSQILNVMLKEKEHVGRQGKNRQSIEPSVTEKAPFCAVFPAEGREGQYAQQYSPRSKGNPSPVGFCVHYERVIDNKLPK